MNRIDHLLENNKKKKNLMHNEEVKKNCKI